MERKKLDEKVTRMMKELDDVPLEDIQYISDEFAKRMMHDLAVKYKG